VASVKLSTVRDLARLYADERPGGAEDAFIPDADVNRLVNAAIRELYEMLVRARGHEYYETRIDGSDGTYKTTAGVATVTLPTDFLQLLSLALLWSARDIESVDALESIDDRAGLVRWGVWGRESAKAFRIRGNVIEFFPTPTASTFIELRYVPQFADLTEDADTFDSVHGWERLVALRVALELLTIGGDPTGAVQKLYDQEIERIERIASDRAAAHPPRVRDVVYEESRRRGSWRRLGGVP